MRETTRGRTGGEEERLKVIDGANVCISPQIIWRAGYEIKGTIVPAQRSFFVYIFATYHGRQAATGKHCQLQSWCLRYTRKTVV